MRELDVCGIGFVADARGRTDRSIVEAGLSGLAHVKHRGAVAADALTSDGTGVLTAIPPALFGEGRGVLVLFCRGEPPQRAVEQAARDEGLVIVEWRTPPTDDSVLGAMARATRPEILQAIVERAPRDGAAGGTGEDPADLERRAYRFRRRIERAVDDVYAVSCSFRTIVYKGLVAADHLADFYLDLHDERYTSPFVVFHQRFSTNTLPTWERAQPFRLLCHNGEINTLQGNEMRMRGRGRLGTDQAGLGDEELFIPVLDPRGSDSAKLDEAAELLLRGGRHICHAMAMLVPEAWEETRDLDPEVRGFYEYHSALMEPWDGPAGVIFTDGEGVGALLDRNGLRPLRYEICEDGLVVCASEVGAVDLSGRGSVERGRLGPGHMLFVTPEHGVVRNHALKHVLARNAPYAQWAAEGFRRVRAGAPMVDPLPDLLRRQAAHGYNKEELAMVLKPMAHEGHEPTFAMGDDSPLPPIAGRPRPVHHYLRQRFAQVTNPPIDPLRERLVMSLRALLGPRGPLLEERPERARLLALDSFFLFPSAIDWLHDPERNPFTTAVLDATFAAADGPAGLEAAVRALADRAARAVADGAGILIIDQDRVGPERAPVPSLLACGAVQHRLVEERRRADTSIVVIADDARDVHSVAALIGYGADAVCPRLALATVAAEADADESESLVGSEAQDRLRAALEAGVLKILSKMGISTVDSYRGAQIFEVLGLGPEVVEVCFRGTPSIVGGIGWEELGRDVLALHAKAYGTEQVELDSPGFFRVRKGGEPHAHSKEVVQALNDLTLVQETPPLLEADPLVADMAAAHLLQRAIRGEDDGLYEQFARLVDERAPIELHDLLEAVPLGDPVPLEEVEPASAIVRRFSTGAMSHGALSKEAHETLAQAMNLLGARSNCGEGGEDPERYRTRGLGRLDKNSRIKQVASGRFGVTPEYLAFADEVQIKIAQGSKPGEGGQLPGHKVSPEIARLRYTQPGVGLISPPPHHDIYSIEDLAQLIYDLKQVNAAEVSVKLVAEDGVGTIAAGVVKALADVVHISGANGGTGASPLSSIKHAGMPWEIGLADTQRALVDNGLRSRARVRVDGGFKTGRQVVIAALLGADEYSFGTAVMIAEGCIMLRACHRDTCKPGVATQRPHLRANFSGTPEGVAAYLLFVAEDVRRHLARLGARSLDEVIGRVELLRQRTTGDPRADAIDLTRILAPPEHPDEPRRFVERVALQDPRSELGDRLLADAFRGVWDGDEVSLSYPITNADRAVGTALSGAIALEFGSLPPRGTAHVHFEGTAGQSFGAFLTHGVELDLLGAANDYVGKGMAGGRIVIRPPANDSLVMERRQTGSSTVLAGNTCLYGATGGELFVAGAAGERFAVRNSGALAVVEAVGDHCCEYMTGGTVVVLGRIGYNLGAGMTGGEAFVWDPMPERVMTRVNQDLVEVLRPDHDDVEELRWLVERHVWLTGSRRGQDLLDGWESAIEHLWHIVPRERVARITAGAARRVTTA
ncbi:glutamate synthase-related protein [Rhabdothermincola sp.]|uniref:glutamate synthase-related protein n=1 Tax=Rhabdothermincola sp. TaxID=2820405 RepID=UPI002FE2DD96